MNFDAYTQVKAWNWSLIKHALKSPLAVQDIIQGGDKDTSKRGVERAVHCIVLEGDEAFEDRYAVYTGGDRRGKVWEAFEVCNEGREILKASEVAHIRQVAECIRNNADAAELLAATGETEVTIRWKDPVTGFDCKGRVDKLSRLVVDLKGTGSVVEHILGAQARKLLWLGQLAFYHDGALLAGHDVDGAAILAYEENRPHDVGVFRYEPEHLEAGRKQYRYCLDTVAECIASGRWPGRYSGVQKMPISALPYEGDTDDEITPSEDSVEDVP
jgi:hypothetical protein